MVDCACHLPRDKPKRERDACCLRQVMMTHERCPEEDAEAILSNLKMEGRGSATPCNLKSTFTHCRCPSRGYTVEAWS